jgi:hypothetical protein
LNHQTRPDGTRDQYEANLSSQIIQPSSLLAEDAFHFTPAERQRLRRLAGEVAALAARPIEQRKRQLWLDHNTLRPTRPVVLCDPETSWSEIIPAKSLECVNPTARGWEFHLRREIFWGAQMNDDRVVMPSFDVSHVADAPDWGATERMIQTAGEDRTAYTWEAPVKTEADWEQIHAPVIRVDFDATGRLVTLASEVFGDLLPVRLKTQWWWSLGMTWTLIKLRGMETLMFDLTKRPAFVQRMLSTLRDGTLAMLAALEQAGLLGLNWDGTYVGSGGYGWTEELPAAGHTGPVRLADLWGFAESQETVGISPRMFANFILPYQLPILEKFGLNCYGCCEPLDERWKSVQGIPRLRRVSVSPWSDREQMAAQLGDRYIFSMKPNPAALAMDDFDEAGIRAELRRDLALTRNCRVEVIMKDVTTLLHDPRRATRWVEIAQAEAEAL